MSAIVLNRNGAEQLQTLLAGIEQRTDYPELELMVVDNGSSDDSLDVLRTPRGGPPLKIIANAENLSFSAANNAAAATADGELLLFLNNDVEPFEPGWLRELVACHESSGAASIGATLLHTEDAFDPPADEWPVQHRGIRFRWEDDAPRAINIDEGVALFAERFGTEVQCPAVTGACLLINRERFLATGGFNEGYRYGSEDVDLCLSLAADGGRAVCSGRAHLFHDESRTQEAEGLEFRRLNRQVNARHLLGRWGPQLRREHRLAALARDVRFTADVPHAAITLTDASIEAGWGDWYTAHELGDALGRLGGASATSSASARSGTSCRDDVDDLVLLMDAFDLAGSRRRRDRRLDPQLDRALARAAVARSARPPAGLLAHARRELVEERPGATVHVPARHEPGRFTPRAPDERRAADYVFTGNRWGEERAIERALRPRRGERVGLYGRGWEERGTLAPPRGGPAPYDDLPAIYAPREARGRRHRRARPSRYGAVNARVFDALAAGTPSITNCEAGVRELFDDEFPVWDAGSRCAAARRPARTTPSAGARSPAATARVLGAPHLCAPRATAGGGSRTGASAARSASRSARRTGRSPSGGATCTSPRALRRELRRHGHRVTVAGPARVGGRRRDCATTSSIALKGLSSHQPKPGQLNVLWCISHPDAAHRRGVRRATTWSVWRPTRFAARAAAA